MIVKDILVQEDKNDLFGQFEDNGREEMENKSIEARRITLKKFEGFQTKSASKVFISLKI